jgi:phosphatidyl-myo-inositol dimannoside synthase
MERFSWELIRHLKKSPALDVSVLAHRGTRRTSPFFAIAVIPRALWAARRCKVVHLGDPMLSLVGWLIRHVYGRPVAVTVHGFDVSYRQRLYQLYLRLFFHHFDLYLPISAYVNSLLASRSVTGQRLVINPNVSDRYFDPSINRQRLNALLQTENVVLPPNATILFTSGRLVKRKGHAWFIKRVLPQLPVGTIYLIAGAGPEKESITATAIAAKVASRVIMLGRVSNEALKVLYNSVDAFVQPNRHVEDDVEGFGLVLLEAATCQRTVLAAKTDGIPDAIHDGRNGILIPAGNSRAWRQHLADIPNLPAARSYTVAHFVWPRAADQYRQVLLGLLDRHTTMRSA